MPRQVVAVAVLVLLLVSVVLGAQARPESPFGGGNNPTINATGGLTPTITVGFRYLALPPDVQLFVYFHVCAHHVRDDVLPGDRFRATNQREYAADCDAAMRMRVRDMLTPQLLDLLRAVIPDSRIGRLVACVNSA